MKKKWQLRADERTLVLIPGRDLYPAEAAVYPPARLVSHLAGWLEDPTSHPVLLGLYEYVGGPAPVGAERQEVPAFLRSRVRPRLVEAFTNREVVALPVRRAFLFQVKADAAEGGPPGKKGQTPQAPPARRNQKTWIEIELVDDGGRPVAGERFRVQLPDGTYHEGITDERGRARYQDLDPGECEVAFPDLDAREWKPA